MSEVDIKVGTPVIINDCDRPCARLVAIVSKATASNIEAIYLTSEISMEKCSTYKTKNVTRLSDFGVKLSVDNGMMTCSVTSESHAIYEDGRRRSWQPEGRETWPVRAEALALYLNGEKNETDLVR